MFQGVEDEIGFMLVYVYPTSKDNYNFIQDNSYTADSRIQ